MSLGYAGWDRHWSDLFAKYEDSGLNPARIFKQNRELYGIYTERGEADAGVAGGLLYRAEHSELPVVGDWVTVRQHVPEDLAIINDVLPRRTKFSRKTAGPRAKEQVIAANIDLLCIVCGLDHDFNLRRLERYLVAAGENGAKVLIVLNKADLCPDASARTAEVRNIAADSPVVALSALDPNSATSLLPYMEPGKTVALMGSSGAGKSTLVNQLLGKHIQATRATRASDGRGHHTTSQRELFLLPGGGLILDNPGIRELQLWPEHSSLSSTFTGVEEIVSRCRFRDCSHDGDRGCAFPDALASGELDAGRWQSYRKLQRELRHISVEIDENARRKEKERMKKLCKAVNRNPKRK